MKWNETKRNEIYIKSKLNRIELNATKLSEME